MVKNPPVNAWDAKEMTSILGSGGFPGAGNSNPLQYSCLGKFHGQRRLVGYSSGGCKESDRTDQQTVNILSVNLIEFKDTDSSWIMQTNSEFRNENTYWN